jgi:hypothetical protein
MNAVTPMTEARTILPRVKNFVRESPIAAHAYKNERDFLYYEFARAKVIQWGETAYALILMERQLKHGESDAPRSWTST